MISLKELAKTSGTLYLCLASSITQLETENIAFRAIIHFCPIISSCSCSRGSFQLNWLFSLLSVYIPMHLGRATLFSFSFCLARQGQARLAPSTFVFTSRGGEDEYKAGNTPSSALRRGNERTFAEQHYGASILLLDLFGSPWPRLV